jgi:hypothetical protein
MEPDADPSPPQPTRTGAPMAARMASLPPLIYVLAAFGVIAGAFGATQAIANAGLLLKPREAYVDLIAARNELMFKPMVPAADLERYGVREAETRYGRRNAALPLAAVGLILSSLLFAGCMRAMRGDAWGLSAWTLAASASIPYQLISTALDYVIASDVTRAFVGAPASAMPLAMHLQTETLGSILMGGLSTLYFAACVLYLRNPSVRRRFSDGGTRTPPSA